MGKGRLWGVTCGSRGSARAATYCPLFKSSKRTKEVFIHITINFIRIGSKQIRKNKSQLSRRK